MHSDHRIFTDDESDKLVKKVDISASIYGTTIRFEINSPESRALVYQQLLEKRIPVKYGEMPNQISVRTKLFITEDISKALDLLVENGHLSASLSTKIKTNYPDGCGHIRPLGPAQKLSVLFKPLKELHAPAVSAPTPSIMSRLISEGTLLRRLEERHLEEHRHDDPRLQHEYDKRHGLILREPVESSPIKTSALLSIHSALYQSPEKASASLGDAEDFVMIEGSDRTTDPVRSEQESSCRAM